VGRAGRDGEAGRARVIGRVHIGRFYGPREIPAALPTRYHGANDGNYSLEATAHAIVSVWLVEYDSSGGLYYTLGSSTADPFLDAAGGLLPNFTRFSLQISPVVRGAPWEIERATPMSLNEVMNLR